MNNYKMPEEKKHKKSKEEETHEEADDEETHQVEIENEDSEEEGEDDDSDDSDEEGTMLTDMGLYNVLGNFLIDENGQTIGMSLANIAKELSKLNHILKNSSLCNTKDKKKEKKET